MYSYSTVSFCVVVPLLTSAVSPLPKYPYFATFIVANAAPKAKIPAIIWFLFSNIHFNPSTIFGNISSINLSKVLATFSAKPFCKDDDYYDRYDSKEKELKVGELKRYEEGVENPSFNRNTCRFMYTLFAVLMDCDKKGSSYRKIYTRDYESMYLKELKEGIDKDEDNNLEKQEEAKTINQSIVAIEHAEEKGIDKKDDEELESIDLDDEDDDEEDSEDNNLEEEKSIKQSSENEKLSELTKKKETTGNQLENKQNNDEDEKFSNSMNKFNEVVKSTDITYSEGLNAVENNLRTAVELLYDSTAIRQIKLLIKPAAIQKLLTTFQNLRKTQLDNVLKTIPSNLPKERKNALVTIYKNDFWEAYEQEVRDFLSKETNMLKSTDKTKVKLKNKGNKIKEKFKDKKDKIVNKVKSKLDFGLKDEENYDYDNVLDNIYSEEEISGMNFKKEISEGYSIPQVEGDSVQQKIIDLVASTLRPKDPNNNRTEENTYSNYYSEVQKIMDKYMKDDDYYDRYDSKEKELKVGELKRYEEGVENPNFNRNTCRFMYTLFAVLMDCDKKGSSYRKIYTRDYESMYLKELQEGIDDFEKINLSGKKCKDAYEALKKSCVQLTVGTIPKKQVRELLKNFTDVGEFEMGKLFHDLCSGDDLKPLDTNNDFQRYFAKLLKEDKTKE